MFDASEVGPEMMRSRTLMQTARCEGIGLHTGEMVSLAIMPAPAGTGIRFRRTDLLSDTGPASQAAALDRVTILATPHAVSATTLGTVIQNRQGVTLSTVEHLMAAFAGFGIDNALVEVTGPEVPIMDGSSAPFTDMIATIGVRTLSAPRRLLRVERPVRVEKGDSFIVADPLPAEEAPALSIDVTVDYADPAIGRQRVTMTGAHEGFAVDLASARTFCNLSDVEMMRAQGLALGGSLDNAIVVDEGQILNEGGLRLDREFVRHKALDLIGDLHLIGGGLIGRITAYKPGHELNTMLARALVDAGTMRDADAAFDAEQSLAAHA